MCTGLQDLPYFQQCFVTLGHTTGIIDQLEILKIQGNIEAAVSASVGLFLLEAGKIITICQRIHISQTI